MRELGSGLRRGRSATAAAIAAVREAEEEERNQSSNGRRMVIRIKLNNKKNNTKQQQPEPPPPEGEKNATPIMDLDNEEEDRELETRCFDEIREIGLNVVGNLETEENYDSNTVVEELDEGEEEDQGNRTPDPYEEACEYLKQSAAAAVLRTNDEMSAKKRCLEKGLLTQTPLHESSNSYEIFDDRRDGSVPFAAPECEVTNHNYEMYDHRHDGSVPVDIPECETTKDDV
ncbi:hypothetical protein MKW94_027023, partial [Papaver nudicaule]|nr:hypothetical protein [Papaver nudicaule]